LRLAWGALPDSRAGCKPCSACTTGALNQAPCLISGHDGSDVPGLWCGGYPSGNAGVPPAQSPAQPWPSLPLGLTRNCALGLLRLGRWGCHRQAGTLQHRAKAQRQPRVMRHKDAGGTLALPGASMAGQVQIPIHGIILQEHSAPTSCLIPNYPKGSIDKRAGLLLNDGDRYCENSIEAMAGEVCRVFGKE